MKTTELTGMALDYAVAICEGGTDFRYDTVSTYWMTFGDKDRALSKGWGNWLSFKPSTDWARGGQIIEREKIEFKFHHVVVATIWYRDGIGSDDVLHKAIGKTPLEAAMRCYVKSKLGDEIELPEGLK